MPAGQPQPVGLGREAVGCRAAMVITVLSTASDRRQRAIGLSSGAQPNHQDLRKPLLHRYFRFLHRIFPRWADRCVSHSRGHTLRRPQIASPTKTACSADTPARRTAMLMMSGWGLAVSTSVAEVTSASTSSLSSTRRSRLIRLQGLTWGKYHLEAKRSDEMQ